MADQLSDNLACSVQLGNWCGRLFLAVHVGWLRRHTAKLVRPPGWLVGWLHRQHHQVGWLVGVWLFGCLVVWPNWFWLDLVRFGLQCRFGYLTASAQLTSCSTVDSCLPSKNLSLTCMSSGMLYFFAQLSSVSQQYTWIGWQSLDGLVKACWQHCRW